MRWACQNVLTPAPASSRWFYLVEQAFSYLADEEELSLYAHDIFNQVRRSAAGSDSATADHVCGAGAAARAMLILAMWPRLPRRPRATR